MILLASYYALSMNKYTLSISTVQVAKTCPLFVVHIELTAS